MPGIIRFYFSFRSPYAWFAAERWPVEMGGVPAQVQRIPFYPTAATFPNDPTRVPAKYRYIVSDVLRLAQEYGLTVVPPASLDTDWGRAHAAWLGVASEQSSRAEPFMLEMFRARFSRGQDVALDEVIVEAAERAGADPALALRSAVSNAFQSEVSGNFALGQARDGIFGAPSFVYEGELFWGHDRIHHLRAAVLERALTAHLEPCA